MHARFAESPAVSVVVPTRGGRGYLEAALSSIVAQTIAELEVFVVVDDPSPTALRELPEDPRFHLLHSAGAGASAARNLGLSASRGDVVAFLDDDDLWAPTKLERQLAWLASRPECCLVGCGFRRVVESTGESETVRLPPRLEIHELLRSTYFGCSIPAIRRASLVAIGGFDETLAGSQDRDLWLRLRRQGEFAFVDEELATVRVHAAQMSAELARKIDAKRRLLRKHGADYRRHPREHAHQLVRLGMMLSASGRPWAAVACFLRAALRDRREPGARALLLEASRSPLRQRRRLLAEGFRRFGDVVHYW